MAVTKTADAVKLNLRLPPALHKRLVTQARRNSVSLNQEIVNQLEGHDERTRALIVKTVAAAMAALVGRGSPEMDAILREIRESSGAGLLGIRALDPSAARRSADGLDPEGSKDK
jgi:hypothetical protein